MTRFTPEQLKAASELLSAVLPGVSVWLGYDPAAMSQASTGSEAAPAAASVNGEPKAIQKMTIQPSPEVREVWAAVDGPIGGEDDRQLRFNCMREAIAATPKHPSNVQVAEILITARQFAQFALDGTTPAIQMKASPSC